MVRWEAFEPRRSATPVYRQLADWVAAQIESGELEAGTQLPAERRLAEIMGLSVDTIRAAVAVLRERGLVETGHGTGSFVTDADR